MHDIIKKEAVEYLNSNIAKTTFENGEIYDGPPFSSNSFRKSIATRPL